MDIKHLSKSELEAGKGKILRSPKDGGELKMIVRRPAQDQRETLPEGQLDIKEGLVGDYWHSRKNEKGEEYADMQITLMNSRVISLLAQDKSRWSLAGDQLYVDLDLSVENLPPGTRLSIGSSILEITAVPHTGCGKFMERYGAEATKFVNNSENKKLRLRGINAKVVKAGLIQKGDMAHKLKEENNP